jgi:hypothetical protein
MLNASQYSWKDTTFFTTLYGPFMVMYVYLYGSDSKFTLTTLMPDLLSLRYDRPNRLLHIIPPSLKLHSSI